MYIADTIACIV